MRSPVPGDPASLAAAGATVRRVSRDLESLRGGGTTAYASMRDVWGTSTSVRTRKQGARAMDALAGAGRHAEVVGEALQTYAAELSGLQARARAVLDAARAAGLVVEDGRVRHRWGVTGEADQRTMSDRESQAPALQAELDAVAVQHRRRRDRLLTRLTTSTQDLEDLAVALRLG